MRGEQFSFSVIYKGYYTAARRYEFYFRVVKTIFYERAQRVSKILFFYHQKIKFISSRRRVISFIYYAKRDLFSTHHGKTAKLLIYARVFLPKNSVKAGNDVIDILTSEDMENTPLESRM